MEFPFGGRCFDLTHRTVVIGDVGSAPSDQRTDDFVVCATALADLEPDGLYVDPAAWSPLSRTEASTRDLLHAIEHLKLPVLLRITASTDVEAACSYGVAGIDLTSWPYRLRRDVAVNPPVPVVISALDGERASEDEVGSSVIDIGSLDDPGLADRLRHVRGLADRGHVVCCRMPGTHDPASSTWGGLALGLRRGVRLVITTDVTATRRMSHVMARIAESGAGL